eukprot:6061068-Pleurochrysis_carterae.AAC.2
MERKPDSSTTKQMQELGQTRDSNMQLAHSYLSHVLAIPCYNLEAALCQLICRQILSCTLLTGYAATAS